ncbi:MAG: PKD domain-containing protein, partial [Candidatus Woesearchaeota archaeon]|nr:PKD domain-containing protein [Candidatus Woesearchaeota archaeon]
QIQNNGTGNNTPPYSYLWDFGDNAGSSTSATNIISDSKEHVYSAAGSYNIKLRVINSYGVSATVHNLISVTDRPQVNPPSGGGGGNGHSSGGVVTGGGSSGSLLSDTYTCLGNRNIIVTPNDKMLINYKGTNYTLFVKDILTNSVLVKVYPIPSRNLQVTKGDSKSFDLDWNNMNDFTLNVYSTKPNLNANISCDIIPEKAAPVEKLKEEPKTIPEIINNIKEGILSIASEIVPKEKASPIVGSVLALAIIMIGLLSYSIY